MWLALFKTAVGAAVTTVTEGLKKEPTPCQSYLTSRDCWCYPSFSGFDQTPRPGEQTAGRTVYISCYF
jgi:hypothetical protein